MNELLTLFLLILIVICFRDRAPPAQKEHIYQHSKRTPAARPSTCRGALTAPPKTLEFKGFLPMNNTTINISPHDVQHTSRTYTAQEIADAHNAKSVTVRTRWFKWLEKVAPTALLKTDQGYTELANTLFFEFAKVDIKERHAWVADAKERYAREWQSVGVIDCETMPDNVGNTLALIQTNLETSNQNLSLELFEIGDFINQLNEADADFTQAEAESWAANGARKAVAQFKTEEVARAQTLNALRQQRIQGGAN
ncbi:MAG: hypothetical protein AAFY54_01890 [Cyanobacteria bacterium J06648_10]